MNCDCSFGQLYEQLFEMLAQTIAQAIVQEMVWVTAQAIEQLIAK